MNLLLYPFTLLKDFVSDFIKRRRHFTYKEWICLINLSADRKVKKIKSSNMEVVFEYEKKQETSDVV